jgi:hypothetical protein
MVLKVDFVDPHACALLRLPRRTALPFARLRVRRRRRRRNPRELVAVLHVVAGTLKLARLASLATARGAACRDSMCGAQREAEQQHCHVSRPRSANRIHFAPCVSGYSNLRVV